MTATTSPTAAPAGGSRSSDAPRFRDDVQGLRAVAVLLVLGYHAGVPWLPGGFVGVDVFFVISGFLITGLIVREIERTGVLSLRGFYARRAKRLLPATATVFVAVAALTMLVLPVTRWLDIAKDMATSALYLVNWRLADEAVDYLASEGAASPLQHFWSLAVEEQFYILWPLLIVALFWRHRPGVDAGRRLRWGLLAIAVPSFVWSIYLTATNPGAAYFVTTTRVWELAIGAILAVSLRHVSSVPAWLRRVVGWAGLAAIGYAGLTFSAGTAFPGSAAIVPTLGAAAVLYAGSGDGRGEIRALTLRPMRDVGALSYSLYLWHWPLLVVATQVWGREDGTLWLPTGLMVVAASAVPAWFTYRVIELPFHKARAMRVPWRAGVLGVVCVVIGLASAGAIAWGVDRVTEATRSGPAAGAAALGDEPTSSDAGEPVERVDQVVPALVDAPNDVADVYGDGCHQDQTSPEVTSCTYGDEHAETVIALVGDSHAAHWQPALRRMAEENGWRLDTYTKSSCLFADVTVWNETAVGPYDSCASWQSAVLDRLTAQPPAVTVVSSSGTYHLASDDGPLSRDASFDDLASGVARNWQVLEDAGTEVLNIVDTPSWDTNVPDCVAAHSDDLAECGVSREDAQARSAKALHSAAASQVPSADQADLNDYICPQETCVPIIGGTLVYSDRHHLTATYSRSLAPYLEEPVRELVG